VLTGHIVGQAQLELDRVALGAAEQVFQRMNQFVDVQGLAIQRLPPGERQQAMGQGGRAVGRGHRRVGETADLLGAAVGDVALHQVEAADDPGEHVVEVMGDAAGELAHRFHFLRMAQGIFGALAFEHLVLQALVGLGQLPRCGR
jgi:hypothetical protein